MTTGKYVRTLAERRRLRAYNALAEKYGTRIAPAATGPRFRPLICELQTEPVWVRGPRGGWQDVSAEPIAFALLSYPKE